MSLELVLRGIDGEYSGPRRLPTEPRSKDGKPITILDKVTLMVQDLPSRVDIDEFNPYQIPRTGAPVVDERELYLSQGIVKDAPRSGVPNGVNGALELVDSGVIFRGLRSNIALASEEIGTLNHDMERELAAFVWENGVRYRGLFILRQALVAGSGLSWRVKFTHDHYKPDIPRRPLKP